MTVEDLVGDLTPGEWAIIIKGVVMLRRSKATIPVAILKKDVAALEKKLKAQLPYSALLAEPTRLERLAAIRRAEA